MALPQCAIAWQNTWLKLWLSDCPRGQLGFVNKETKQFTSFEYCEPSKGGFLYKLNVTSAQEGRFFDEGEYQLVSFNDNVTTPLEVLMADDEIEHSTKIFRYNWLNDAYVSSFRKENNQLFLSSYFLSAENKSKLDKEAIPDRVHPDQEISKIFWDKDRLTFEILEAGQDYFLTNPEKSSPIKLEKHSEYYSISLDQLMTQSAKSYIITIDDVTTSLAINRNLAYRVAEADKVVELENHKFKLVSFSVQSTDHQSFYLRIEPLVAQINHAPEKVSNSNFFRSLAFKVMNMIYWCFSVIQGQTRNRILIMSEVSDELVGNLKQFNDKVMSRRLDQRYQVKVSTRDAVSITPSILSWLKVLWNVAWADDIVLDNYAPLLGVLQIEKRKRLIQLWHAGIGFKSIGYSRFGMVDNFHPYDSVHRKYTYALAPAPNLVDVYEEVFAIPKSRFLPYGMPRLENYLDKSKMKRFEERFFSDNPSLKGKKLILFSPTYRGVNQSEAYYDFSKLDFDKIETFCGEEFIFAIKLHPFTKISADYWATRGLTEKEISHRTLPDLSKYRSIVDLTGQYDINDLFYVTDILITDYSSAYYDYVLLQKPVMFYTYDRIDYELIHGVERPVKESAPGKVVDNFDDLLLALSRDDFELEKTKKFRENYYPENINNASDRLIDFLWT
jgi:CDP-glycerol glycerophosphotransferase (TagB/SpsB family)